MVRPSLFEVFDFFEEAIFDEEFGIALPDKHARPDLGDEE